MQENGIENAVYKMVAILSDPQCVKLLSGNEMWEVQSCADYKLQGGSSVKHT